MNLLNPRRTELGGVPFLNNALDFITARINKLWSVEHNNDGTHSDVTAETLTVSGDTTFDGDVLFSGLVGPINFGDENTDIELEGIEIGPETFRDYSDGYGIAATADTVRPALESGRDFVPDEDDEHNLGWVGDGDFVRRWKAGYFSQVVHAPTVIATTGYWERGRSIAAGEWQAVTFSAGNFTANAAMTWTVGSGDVVVNRYTIVGKTMRWTLGLATTTVGGTPNTELRATVPGGFTLAGACWTALAVCSDNGVQSVGYAEGASGLTYVTFKLNFGATNWTASANNTGLFVTMTLEVA
jgi:hypothetical protein